MLLANKIKSLLLVLLFPFCGLMAQQEGWSAALNQKVNHALVSLYETEAIRIAPFEIKDAAAEESIKNLNEGLFKVFEAEELKAYIYVSQAPSMKNVFDYLVILSPDFEIVKSKVLIYREQHGRQIGSARWLNQFNGMTPSDRPTLGKDIDGISGATISVKGMTKAVNDLLTAISLAQEKGVL